VKCFCYFGAFHFCIRCLASPTYCFRCVDRPHYGTEFRIELIDATTDKPVGTSLITTQGLLQEQRDYLVEEKKVPFLSFVRPIRFEGTRRMVKELRAGLKPGFSSSEYYASRTGGVSTDGEVRPGKTCVGD